MHLTPEPTSLLSFIADKKVLYIDGNFYFTRLGVDEYKPRGRHSRIYIDEDAIVFNQFSYEERVPLNEVVVACNDVAILRGAIPSQAKNAIIRWTRPRITDMSWFLQDRTSNFIYDYKIVKDSHGKQSKDRSRWLTDPGIVEIPATRDFGARTLINFANPNTANPEKEVEELFPGQRFIQAGRRILFSDDIIAEETRHWV